MRPVMRRPVSKRGSAGRFRSMSRRSKAPNISQGPMRGGWRF